MGFYEASPSLPIFSLISLFACCNEQNYFTSATARTFNIVINGITQIATFSAYGVAGAKNLAVNVTINGVQVRFNTLLAVLTLGSLLQVVNDTSPNNNQMEITFVSVTNTPQVSWISITPEAVDAELFGAPTASYQATGNTPVPGASLPWLRRKAGFPCSGCPTGCAACNKATQACSSW